MRTGGPNEKEWKIIIINDTLILYTEQTKYVAWMWMNENENTEDNMRHLHQVIKYISNEFCPRAYSLLESILCSFRKCARN